MVVDPNPTPSQPGYVFKGNEEAAWALFLGILGPALVAVITYMMNADPSVILKPEVLVPAVGLILGRTIAGGLQAALPKIIEMSTPRSVVPDPESLALQLAPLIGRIVDERLNALPPATPPPAVYLPDGTSASPPPGYIYTAPGNANTP